MKCNFSTRLLDRQIGVNRNIYKTSKEKGDIISALGEHVKAAEPELYSIFRQVDGQIDYTGLDTFIEHGLQRVATYLQENSNNTDDTLMPSLEEVRGHIAYLYELSQRQDEVQAQQENLLSGTLKDYIEEGQLLGKQKTGEDAVDYKIIPIEKIAGMYFKDFPEQLEDFREFFYEMFVGHIIRNQVGTENFVETDINKVLTSLQETIRQNVEQYDFATMKVSDLLSHHSNVAKAYFSYVIQNEFDSFVSEFLPGVSIIKDVKKRGRWKQVGPDTTRKKYENSDGSTSGFDQRSALLKMYMDTTPRLVWRNGRLHRDHLKRHLSNMEFKNVAVELSRMPSNIEEFRAALESRVDGVTQAQGQTLTTLNSIYQRFLAAEPYVVDGVEYVSLYQMKQNGDVEAEKILNSFITAVTSWELLNRLVSRNGHTRVDTPVLTEARASIKAEIQSNIAHPTKRNVISKKTHDAIVMRELESEDPDVTTFEIIVGGVPIRYKSFHTDGPTRGFLVQVDDETAALLADPRNLQRALAAVGMPVKLRDTDFLNYYKEHIQAHAQRTSGDAQQLSLANLVGNFAFVLAHGNQSNANLLHRAGVHLNETSHVNSSNVGFKYDPSDLLYGYIEPLAEFAEVISGVNAKTTEKNLDGNIVTKVGVKSRLHETQQFIRGLTTSAQLEASVFRRNSFMTGKMSLLGWALKDGIIYRGIRRTNKEMTLGEQFRYLISDLFLQHSAKTGFREAIIQTNTMADRSSIPTAIVRSEGSNPDFLPINLQIQTDPTEGHSLEIAWLVAEKARHEDLSRTIAESWRAQLNEWKNNDQPWAEGYSFQDVENLKTARQVDAFLVQHEIPLSAAQSSKILVDQLMYVRSARKGTVPRAGVKLAFLHMYDILQDKKQALNFIRGQAKKFKSEVRKSGYTDKALSDNDVEILKTRFGHTRTNKELHNLLLESFFYQSNLVANDLSHIMAGSIYQFPGEYDSNLVESNNYMKSVVTQIEQDPHLNEVEKKELRESYTRTFGVNVAMNSMFTTQAKRNAILTSGYQRPTITQAHEIGKGIGSKTKVALVADEEILVELLGALNHSTTQEPFDAVMFAHPLYTLRLNHSLGGELSGYMSKGGAIKDVSSERDPITGVVRAQKKATFSQFANELLKKSPRLSRLFRKMNSQITFEPISITLDGQTVNTYLVDQNGQPMKVKEGFREGEDITNMQELWEYFGGLDADDAWVKVLDVLQYNPTNRDNYIEKVGFKSGEKTGNRAYNTSDIWNNVDTEIIYTEFDNMYHGVILNPDADPDSTTSEESTKALMTQMIAAVAFEGDTMDLADNINEALAAVSEQGLEDMERSILNVATRLLRNKLSDPDALTHLQREQASAWSYNPHLLNSDQLDGLYQLLEDTGLLREARSNYVSGLVEDAIRHRESFGSLTDLVGENALDSMSLNGTVHGTIMAEIEKRTVKAKFKGQEMVVAAGHEFLQLYDIKNEEGKVIRSVMRDEYVKSPHVLFQVVTPELEYQLFDMADSDPIRVDGREEVPMWKALQEYGSIQNILSQGSVEIKIIPEESSRDLQWMNYYSDSLGKGLHDLDIYKALQINGELIKRAGRNHGYVSVDALTDIVGITTFEAMALWRQSAQELDIDLTGKYLGIDQISLIQERFVEAIQAELMREDADWETNDTEVYLPMTHMRSYNLDNPITGDPDNIQISDIMGDSPEVEYVNRYGVVVDSHQPGATARLVTVRHYKNGKEVSGPGLGTVAISDAQLQHMTEFFANRIRERARMDQRLGRPSRYPELETLFKPFKSKNGEVSLDSIRLRIEQYEDKLADLPKHIEYYHELTSQRDRLKTFVQGLGDITTHVDVNAVNRVINENITDKIRELAKKQALSFPKTLQIIAGRVPGQGKQSYTAATVKGFITSNRNAIYGPAAMLTITGADHDVDKAHVLVYSVDRAGRLYDYEKYLDDNGKISKALYTEHVEQLKQEIVENMSDNSDEAIRRAIDKMYKQESFNYKEGVKNYVIDMLRQSVRDPRNAIEATMPVSMDYLKKLVEDFKSDYSALLNLDRTQSQEARKKAEEEGFIDGDGGVLTGAGHYVSPYNPASIVSLEKINSVGNDSIAINAVGLKGFSAITTAAMLDPQSAYMRFGDEGRILFGHLKDQNVVSNLVQLYSEMIEDGTIVQDEDADNDSVNMYRQLPGGGGIQRISRQHYANTERWLSDNPYEGKFLASKQAWEQISQLLSAATDNANELILGNLNIDQLTNGLVISAVVLGFDLDIVLRTLNTPEMLKVIRKTIRQRDTIYNAATWAKDISKIIEDSVKDRFRKGDLSLSGIASRVAQRNREREILNSGVRSATEYAGRSLVQEIIYLPSKTTFAFSDDQIGENLKTHRIDSKVSMSSEEEQAIRDYKIYLAGNQASTTLTDKELLHYTRLINSSDTVIVSVDMHERRPAMNFIKYYTDLTGKEAHSVALHHWRSELGGDELIGKPPVLNGRVGIISHSGLLEESRRKLINSAINAHNAAIHNPLTYDQTINEQLKSRQENYEVLDASARTALKAYLTDGPRQLHVFSKMALEMRALTGILGVSSGVPNSDWDLFSYYQRFTSTINQVNDGFIITPEQFKEFIQEVMDGVETPALVTKYNQYKVGVNVFHVLTKNRHYFSYLKAVQFGLDLVRSTTYTNELTEKVAGLIQPKRITEDGYYNVRRLVQDAAIDGFLNNSSMYRSIKIGGLTYHLHTPEGRANFILELPQVVQTLRESEASGLTSNLFLQRLIIDDWTEHRAEDSYPIIKTEDLNNLPAVDKSKYRLSLQKLKEDGGDLGKELYDALYFYSLIAEKGSSSRLSFDNLFELEETAAKRDYLRYQKELNPEALHERIQAQGIARLLLLAPRAIREVSTVDSYKYRRSSSTRSAHSAFYKIPKRSPFLQDPVIKSAQTGKVYVDSNTEGLGMRLGYVVVTPTRPTRANNFSSHGMGIGSVGWQWGETASIPMENGQVVSGQVLQFNSSEGNYWVKIGDDFLKKTAQDLIEHNPTMIFDGENFGQLPPEDRSKPELAKKLAQGRTQDALWNQNIQYNHEMVKEIEDNSLRYRAFENIPTGTKVNDIIGYYDLGGGRTARMRYMGYGHATARVRLGMGYHTTLTGFEYSFKNGKEPAHIVAIEPLFTANVPSEETTDRYEIVRFQNPASKENRTATAKVRAGKATYFFSSDIEGTQVNGPVLMNLAPSNWITKAKWYKVTKVGPMNTMDDASLYSQLNLKKSRRNTKLLRNSKAKSGGDTQYLYRVEPYNAREDSVNSLSEYRFLDDISEANLQDWRVSMVDFGVTTPGKANTQTVMSGLLAKYGASGVEIAVSDPNNTHSPEYEDVLDRVHKDATKFGGRGVVSDELTQRVVNILVDGGAENRTHKAVVIFDDFTKSTIDELGTEVDSWTLNKSEKRLGEIIVQEIAYYVETMRAENEDFALTEAQVLGQLYENKNDDPDITNLFLKIQSTSGLASPDSIIGIIGKMHVAHLQRNSNVSKELLYRNHSNTFVAAQAAKHLNQDLYIYSPTREQWYRYDRNTGNYRKTRIPMVDNNFLVFNPRGMSAASRQGFDSLLKKNSNQRAYQDTGYGSGRFVDEMVVGTIPANPEINTVDDASNTDEVFLQSLKDSPQLGDLLYLHQGQFTETVRVEDENGEFTTQTLRAHTHGDQQYTVDQFENWDPERVSINYLPDGTISIALRNEYDQEIAFYAYFPNKATQEAYANYTGKTVKEDMKVRIGDHFLIFDELHLTDREAFTRRDALIEEKLKVKKAFESALSFYTSNVAPLYRAARYGTLEQRERFKHHGNYNTFMMLLANGQLDLSGINQELVTSLEMQHTLYHDRYEKAMKTYYDTRSEVSNVVKVLGMEGTFMENIDTVQADEQYRWVYPTNYSRSVEYEARRHVPADKSYALVMLDEERVEGRATKVGEDRVADYQAVKDAFDNLIKQAQKNPNIKYYIDLPADMHAKVHGEITALQLIKALAHAASYRAYNGIPDNIIFTGGRNGNSHPLNSFIGGLDPSKINTAQPFRFTSDVTESNIFDIGYYNLNRTINGVPMHELWNIERGYNPKERIYYKKGAASYSEAAKVGMYNALKNLWRRWANAHPDQFEKLAMDVGRKKIWDRTHDDNSGFSNGKILADLLTERYVDNSWIMYPRNPGDAHMTYDEVTGKMIADQLRPGQYGIPVSMTEMKNMRFLNGYRGVGGKAIVSIEGRNYIATIHSVDNVIDSDQTEATAHMLGITDVDNYYSELIDTYGPIVTDGEYAILSLQEFAGEVAQVTPSEVGEFASRLEGHEDLVTEEHLALASRATVTYALDTKSKITLALHQALTGTPRIQAIKSVIGDGIVLDVTTEDSVHIFGSTLEDGNSPLEIAGTVSATKALIDRVARVGVKEILIGNETGIDEELRAYISAHYPKYARTEFGFTLAEVDLDMKQNIVVYKSGPSVRRFNANNLLEREGNPNTKGSKLHGAHGTVFNTTIAEGGLAYNLAVDNHEIMNWDAPVDSSRVADILHRHFGIEVVGQTGFGASRGSLAVQEKTFIERYVALLTLSRAGIELESLTSTNDIDVALEQALVDDQNATFYKDRMDSFFVDGRFKVSDTAILAMSRSRGNTLSHIHRTLKSVSELDILRVEESPIFKSLNRDRLSLERDKTYYRMLNDRQIDEATYKLILDDQQMTLGDAYQLLKTFGSYKILLAQGHYGGQIVNKILTDEFGIKVIQDGNRYVVIDNEVVHNFNFDTAVSYDTAEGRSHTPKWYHAELAQRNSALYRYLTGKGLIRFDEQSMTARVILGDEVHIYDLESDYMPNLMEDISSSILNNVFSTDRFKGVDLSESLDLMAGGRTIQYSRWKRVVWNHINFGRSVLNDNFDLLFYGRDVDETPTSTVSFVNGQVYQDTIDGVEVKNILIRDSYNSWYKQSEDGLLYVWDITGEWSPVYDENNQPVNNRMNSSAVLSTSGLASPKNAGEISNSLLTTGGVVIKGSFLIEQESANDAIRNVTETIAVEQVSGEVYKWNPLIRAWEAPKTNYDIYASLGTSDMDIKSGDRVLSLLTREGTYVLENGTAVSDTHIKSDNGNFDLIDGHWVLSNESGVEGVFSHPEVKFQKDEIIHVDVDGQRKASQRVSKPVLVKAFNRIFENLNVEAELLNAAEIAQRFGEEYAQARGFVKKGVVYINLDTATLDTPLHELGGHVYLAVLRQTNHTIYEHVIQESLKHPIRNEVARKYKNLSERELGEEIFATLMGIENQNTLQKEPLTMWQKIRNLANETTSIRDFFQGLVDIIFGRKVPFEVTAEDSLFDIIRKVGEDIVLGEQSSLAYLSNMSKADVRKIISPEMTSEEVMDRLKEMGYIKKMCY